VGDMLRPAGAMGEGSGQLGRSSPSRQRLFIAASCFLPLRRLPFRIFLPDFVCILFMNPLTLCLLRLLLRLLIFIGSSLSKLIVNKNHYIMFGRRNQQSKRVFGPTRPPSKWSAFILHPICLVTSQNRWRILMSRF
jgi:hypothetical protein